VTQGSRTGVANLPLHGGKAPKWLFSRMTELAREICIVIVDEFGPDEMLRKMSDPYWFQAFGCVLGFDWHSSGVTTTTCGALKEGIKDIEKDLGLYIAGGKGGTSRKTPQQIESCGHLIKVDPAELVYDSKIVAKVDSSALQDGYQLYHHVFMFTTDGSWAVVQQGMNEKNRYARRYHWLGEHVTDFVNEPHSAICAQKTGEPLNLVASESSAARKVITEISSEQKPEKTIDELKKLKNLELPRRHQIVISDIHPDRIKKTITSTYERNPGNFEELLALPGVGPKTIRALSLISELIYDTAPSFSDPARFSFAHGGKDGIPFPVDKRTYDQSIELLKRAVLRSKVEKSYQKKMIDRLDGWHFGR